MAGGSVAGMGEHKGWTVRMQGKSWLARAWDSSCRKYRNRSFPTESEAKEWAKTQSATYRLRLEAASAPGTATLVRDYLADRARLGRSESHLADMTHVLHQFARVLPDLSHPRAAAIVEGWLAERDDLAPATRNRYLVTVKSLCRWSVRRGRIVRDPLAVIEREQLPDTLKPQFTLDELRRLLAAWYDHYHLAFAVALYTGMRSDEVAHVRWQDVDAGGSVIAVRLDAGARVKRNKERLVPLQPELAALLAAHRPENAEGPILGYVGMHRGEQFAGFLKRCGVPIDGRTPHSARHTYAGLMTASGVPTTLVSAYMGHASTSTTAIYTRLAARYVAGCGEWPRGTFRLMEGLAEPWPRVERLTPKQVGGIRSGEVRRAKAETRA